MEDFGNRLSDAATHLSPNAGDEMVVPIRERMSLLSMAMGAVQQNNRHLSPEERRQLVAEEFGLLLKLVGGK